MFQRFLLCGALAFGLTACQSDEPDVTTVDVEPDVVAADPVVADANPMAAPDVTVQGTIDAVTSAGGLTQLPMDAAAGNVEGWISALDGNPDFAPVVENLRTLQTQLGTSPIDGAAVGATLSALGEQTTAAAAGAGDQQSGLETLGTTLSEAGAALSGM